jgi:hypothetical protein
MRWLSGTVRLLLLAVLLALGAFAFFTFRFGFSDPYAVTLLGAATAFAVVLIGVLLSNHGRRESEWRDPIEPRSDWAEPAREALQEKGKFIEAASLRPHVADDRSSKLESLPAEMSKLRVPRNGPQDDPLSIRREAPLFARREAPSPAERGNVPMTARPAAARPEDYLEAIAKELGLDRVEQERAAEQERNRVAAQEPDRPAEQRRREALAQALREATAPGLRAATAREMEERSRVASRERREAPANELRKIGNPRVVMPRPRMRPEPREERPEPRPARADPLARLEAAMARVQPESPAPGPQADGIDHVARSIEFEESVPQAHAPRACSEDIFALEKLRSEVHCEPQPIEPIRDKDIVDVSVFAPKKVRSSTAALVQVFFHLLDQSELARDLAHEADPLTKRRGAKTLATEIGRGQRIDVILECPGAELLGGHLQSIIWHGRPTACQFIVVLPESALGTASLVRVQILLDSVPIGFIAFSLEVSNAVEFDDTDVRGDERKRYRYAFLSHASGDRTEVLKRAQALRAVGINYFHDLASLRPGDKWEPRLFEEIDKCDLFLLFWSSLAARSEWVRKETEYALGRRGKTHGIPDIMPIILEGPPIAKPPESLKEIHFNDSLLYLIAATEMSKTARMGGEQGG